MEMVGERLVKELKLARLETAFWESCQAVRTSSVSLRRIHAFLMGELLEVEADKRRTLSRRVDDMEVDLAEMKVRSGPNLSHVTYSLPLSLTDDVAGRGPGAEESAAGSCHTTSRIRTSRPSYTHSSPSPRPPPCPSSSPHYHHGLLCLHISTDAGSRTGRSQ